MVIEERDAARGAVIGALERAGHEVLSPRAWTTRSSSRLPRDPMCSLPDAAPPTWIRKRCAGASRPSIPIFR